jgi:hypothetical protein
MASKCLRKLTLVMMEFFILILLKVQAFDLSPTSFSSFGLPILYSHSSELDEVKATIHTCFGEGIKVCEKIWPLHMLSRHQSLGFEVCLLSVHVACWAKQHRREGMSNEHFTCIFRCITHRSDIGSCFTKCYEKHVENHEDIIYKQNP